MKAVSRLAAAALTVVLGAALAACSPAGADADASIIERLQEDGFARTAIAQNPPYSDVTSEGAPDAYTPILAQQILAGLDIPQLDPLITTYDAMIPGLQAGRWDMVTGGLNITSARCEQVLFSQPVSVQRESLTVLAGNPRGLQDLDSVVADSSVRLAVLQGSSQEAYAKEHGVPDGQLVAVPDHRTGVDSVLTGRADAFFVGEFSVGFLLNDSDRSELEIVIQEGLPINGTGVAFRKEDEELRDAFDEGLAAMAADGSLAALYTEWGFTNPEVLLATTRDDLAEGCE